MRVNSLGHNNFNFFLLGVIEELRIIKFAISYSLVIKDIDKSHCFLNILLPKICLLIVLWSQLKYSPAFLAEGKVFINVEPSEEYTKIAVPLVALSFAFVPAV
jgi:hypothetical protein